MVFDAVLELGEHREWAVGSPRAPANLPEWSLNDLEKKNLSRCGTTQEGSQMLPDTQNSIKNHKISFILSNTYEKHTKLQQSAQQIEKKSEG